MKRAGHETFETHSPSTSRSGGGQAVLLAIATLVILAPLVACASSGSSYERESTSGMCCTRTGPIAFDCASIENLGPGADLDGRCNAVNQGQSCSWDYSDEECCKKAVDDGFGDVTCGPSGGCCLFTGPVGFDCASIENLGPGADLDGRCNAVNQGQSCAWDYSDPDCCEKAVDDGFGDVKCGESGECCVFIGPVGFDCASIENLGPGADLDGRCNAVNQGQSCAWNFGSPGCCEIAIGDGFPGVVTCE